MKKEVNKIEKKVKKILASQMGAEPEDIELMDSLVDDLLITPADLSEFIQALNKKGYKTDELHFDEIDTVEDLIESLSAEIIT